MICVEMNDFVLKIQIEQNFGKWYDSFIHLWYMIYCLGA